MPYPFPDLVQTLGAMHFLGVRISIVDVENEVDRFVLRARSTLNLAQVSDSETDSEQGVFEH